MRVDLTSYFSSTKQVLQWAREGQSATVCLGNVHMVMSAYDDPSFADTIASADLVTHDGMPLVWALRSFGHSEIERVYGPHLMMFICQAAAKRGIPIGLYGGTPKVLADLSRKLEERFPGIRIPFQVSPPFRAPMKEEDDRDLKALRESGARILFVGIGCPKQEIWMHRNKRRFAGVMLGVGQAFDIHSGHTRMAPRWIQNLGMEWCFRLLTEPRRLWRRYLRNNPRYMVLLVMQLFDRYWPKDVKTSRNPVVQAIQKVVAARIHHRGPSQKGRK